MSDATSPQGRGTGRSCPRRSPRAAGGCQGRRARTGGRRHLDRFNELTNEMADHLEIDGKPSRVRDELVELPRTKFSATGVSERS